MEGNHLEEELVMAKQIAKAALKNQIDKAGVDYFEHVKTVGDAGETIEEKIVGYLHDVVEDSHITITDLSEHGFSDAILSTVDGSHEERVKVGESTYKELVIILLLRK